MIPLGVLASARYVASGGDINAVTKTFWLDADDYAAGTIGSTIVPAVGPTITHNFASVPAVVATVGGIKEFQFSPGVDSYFSFTPPAGTCDMWAVGVPSGDSQHPWKWGTATSGTHWNFGSANNLYDDSFASTRVGPISGFGVGVKYLLRVKNTVASGRQIWANGTQVYSASGTTPTLPTTALIGAGSSSSTGLPAANQWKGSMHEFICLDETNSTPANEATIKAYLAAKYGLTIA